MVLPKELEADPAVVPAADYESRASTAPDEVGSMRDYNVALTAMEDLVTLFDKAPELLPQLRHVIELFPKDGMTRKEEWRYKQILAKLAEVENKSLTSSQTSVTVIT